MLSIGIAYYNLAFAGSTARPDNSCWTGWQEADADSGIGRLVARPRFLSHGHVHIEILGHC